jgi:hypothetical protein
MAEQSPLPDVGKDKLLPHIYKAHPRKKFPQAERKKTDSNENQTEPEQPASKPAFRPPGGGFGMFPAGFDPSQALKNLKKADDKSGPKPGGLIRTQTVPARSEEAAKTDNDNKRPLPKAVTANDKVQDSTEKESRLNEEKKNCGRMEKDRRREKKDISRFKKLSRYGK